MFFSGILAKYIRLPFFHFSSLGVRGLFLQTRLMADSQPRKRTLATGDHPPVVIVFAPVIIEPPSLEEARIIHAWLEAELLQLFKEEDP